MSATFLGVPTRPKLWWEWGKVLGVALLPLVFTPNVIAAIAAHVFCDFTVQSTWMAVGKAQRRILPLVIHAVVAGGIPGAIAGGLRGAILAAVVHLAVDATGKFGRSGWVGVVLDQAAHVAAIAVAAAAL